MNQNDTITYFNELYQTNKRYLRAGGSGFAYGFHHQPCTPESPMQCWYTIIIIIIIITGPNRIVGPRYRSSGYVRHEAQFSVCTSFFSLSKLDSL